MRSSEVVVQVALSLLPILESSAQSQIVAARPAQRANNEPRSLTLESLYHGRYQGS